MPTTTVLSQTYGSLPFPLMRSPRSPTQATHQPPRSWVPLLVLVASATLGSVIMVKFLSSSDAAELPGGAGSGAFGTSAPSFGGAAGACAVGRSTPYLRIMPCIYIIILRVYAWWAHPTTVASAVQCRVKSLKCPIQLDVRTRACRSPLLQGTPSKPSIFA